VNVSVQDIHQTLEYRSTAAIARLLPTGLLLIFLALVLLALADPACSDMLGGDSGVRKPSHRFNISKRKMNCRCNLRREKPWLVTG
jgi:hypothetical protein